MVGGGSIFGPKPRDYSNKLPTKMKHLARKSALSAKAKEGQIKVVEDFSFDAPKTKEMVAVLKALELGASKTLLLMSKSDQTCEVGTEHPEVDDLRRQTKRRRTIL